jgi:hypothetical protein
MMTSPSFLGGHVGWTESHRTTTRMTVGPDGSCYVGLLGKESWPLCPCLYKVIEVMNELDSM